MTSTIMNTFISNKVIQTFIDHPSLSIDDNLGLIVNQHMCNLLNGLFDGECRYHKSIDSKSKPIIKQNKYIESKNKTKCIHNNVNSERITSKVNEIITKYLNHFIIKPKINHDTIVLFEKENFEYQINYIEVSIHLQNKNKVFNYHTNIEPCNYLNCQSYDQDTFGNIFHINNSLSLMPIETNNYNSINNYTNLESWCSDLNKDINQFVLTYDTFDFNFMSNLYNKCLHNNYTQSSIQSIHTFQTSYNTLLSYLNSFNCLILITIILASFIFNKNQKVYINNTIQTNTKINNTEPEDLNKKTADLETKPENTKITERTNKKIIVKLESILEYLKQCNIIWSYKGKSISEQKLNSLMKLLHDDPKKYLKPSLINTFSVSTINDSLIHIIDMYEYDDKVMLLKMQKVFVKRHTLLNFLWLVLCIYYHNKAIINFDEIYFLKQNFRS